MDTIIVTIKEASPDFVLTQKNEASNFILSGTNSDDVILQQNATVTGNVNLVGPKGESSIKGITCFISGRPLASEVIVGAIVPYNFRVTLAKSAAKALIAGDSENIFIIKKNNITIGTITFAAGSLIGVIAMTDFDFVIGDFVTIHAPTIPDGSLSDLTFLLVY